MRNILRQDPNDPESPPRLEIPGIILLLFGLFLLGLVIWSRM